MRDLDYLTAARQVALTEMRERASNAWRKRDGIDQWRAPRKYWNDPGSASRAYLTPPMPRTWDPPVQSSVANVVVPRASNPAKGSGPDAQKIAQIRSARQAEFERQLAARWQWNLSHL